MRRPQAPALLVVAAAAPAAAQRRVTLFRNQNDLAATPDNPKESGGNVLYLGDFSSTAQCEAACVANPDCNSFKFHQPAFGKPWANGCYGRLHDFAWDITPWDNIDSGRVGGHPTPSPTPAPPPPGECSDDGDCSLNGVCDGGQCACDAAWTGRNCEVLHTVPGEKGAGYWAADWSSWGGTALRADDGTYHMWVAEMTNGCGVAAWLCNSQVTHLVAAAGALGAYERREVVWPVFAHEPRTVRAPTGEFVMYWTGGGDARPGGPINASSCTTHRSCTAKECGNNMRRCSHDRDWDVSLPTFMSWTKDPNGNWSAPVAIPQLSPKIDSNLSPVILADGSVVGLFRNDAYEPYTASNIHVVTASDWRDASTYKEHPEAAGHDGPEDPFVWRDHRGNWHSINHNNQYPNGVHMFSKTGTSGWRVAPGAEGHGRTYGTAIKWADGTEATLSRCERPALIFADDGVTPIALTNGCALGGLEHTCLRPLNTK